MCGKVYCNGDLLGVICENNCKLQGTYWLSETALKSLCNRRSLGIGRNQARLERRGVAGHGYGQIVPDGSGIDVVGIA